MILSNLEQNGTLLLIADGETKNVIMLTDTSTVPYSAYYEMPNGYAEWLGVVVNGNVFSVTARNNLFSDTSRSAVVKFCCMPSSGGTLQTLNVTVTQAADTLVVTFDPTSATLTYEEGATDTIAVAGIPTGATIVIDKPNWLDATLASDTSLVLTATLNTSEVARSGNVMMTVNSRTFYLAVTQAANTLALTFNPTSVAFGGDTDLSDDVDVTGIPVGASVEIVTPDWVDASIATDTITLTADKNPTKDARSDSVAVTVWGRTFYIPVSQSGNSQPNGRVVLDNSSNLFAAGGGTFTVTATEMPTDATVLECAAAPDQGNCAECGNTGAFVSFARIDNTSFKLTVEAQDVFDGIERSYVLVFSAGTSSANFTITQSAPAAVYRLTGMGDKFLKDATSTSLPTFLVEATSQNMLKELKADSWTKLADLVTPLLVGADRDLVPDRKGQQEAYKACHTHVTKDGTAHHVVSMGAMAYRFRFKPEAYGLTIRGLRFKVRSDAYCVDGLRVALQTNNATETPSTDWAVIREGSGGFNVKGYAPRALNSVDKLYYGATKTVVFDGLNLTVDANTRIYIYLTMEDYLGISNGWVYGSGIIAPYFDFFTNALIGGVSENDWITNEETADETDETILTEADIPPEAPRMQNVAASADDVLREFLREVFYISVRTPTAQNNVSLREAFRFMQPSISQFSNGHGYSWDQSEGSAIFGQLLRQEFTKINSWNITEQCGLVASCQHQIGGPGQIARVVMRLSPFVIPVAMPIGAPTQLILKNGSTAISLGGATVRFTAWYVAGFGPLHSQDYPLYAVAALGRQPDFWYGNGEAVSGQVTDIVSKGSQTTIAYDLSATKLGFVEISTDVGANEEVQIPITSVPTTYGMLVIAPFVIDVGDSMASGSAVGLGSSFLCSRYDNNTGWRPGIRFSS